MCSGITRGCESAIHWIIFFVDLSPFYNCWLLYGSWGKILLGALKGSLGGVMPLTPSIPDPFQYKSMSILQKSTTPSNGNTRSNNTSLRLLFPLPPLKNSFMVNNSIQRSTKNSRGMKPELSIFHCFSCSQRECFNSLLLTVNSPLYSFYPG